MLPILGQRGYIISSREAANAPPPKACRHLKGAGTWTVTDLVSKSSGSFRDGTISVISLFGSPPGHFYRRDFCSVGLFLSRESGIPTWVGDFESYVNEFTNSFALAGQLVRLSRLAGGTLPELFSVRMGIISESDPTIFGGGLNRGCSG